MRSRTLPLLTAIGAVAASTVTLAPAASAAGTVRPSFVFTSDRDGDLEIFVRRTDGSTVQVTRNRVDDLQAVWSPDGSRLAVVRQVGQGTALVVMNADGTGARRLTSPVTFADGRASSDSLPAWSPDGRMIAFTSDRASGQEPEIHRIDADGTDLRRLTRTEPFVGDVHPTWSPDGRTIAFTTYGHAIYTVPAASGVERLVSEEPPGGVFAGWWERLDWSPDGSTLVADSITDGIYLVDPVTGATSEELVQTEGAQGSEPVFSPDGTRILYADLRSGDRDLWSMALDGSDQRQLTYGGTPDGDPHWGVVPRRR